jgi:hypothetical protein
MKDKKGMALGGVGGFNTHDAGVLAAAHECGLRPDIITCTSGAIFWTHLFLTNPDGIGDEVKRQADAVKGAYALQVAVLGYPGVFRPAYASYWMRWFDPRWGLPLRGLFDRLFPAQLYEPTRPKEFFDQMAADLGGTPTPVMFNAYAVNSGRELVFCNDAAFSFIGRQPEEQRRHIIPGEEDMLTEYRRIDAEAVRAALWLSLYGFSNRYQGEIAIDGAYQRQLIMSELTDCDVIYAIKPQASAWQDRAPGNYFEVQDFNTEMWFNTSFAAEVAGLWAAPRDPARGKIQITPITMHRPLGYFNYFVERLPNYSEGYEQAMTVFQRDLKANVTPAAHRAPSSEPAAEGAPRAGAGRTPGAEKQQEQASTKS